MFVNSKKWLYLYPLFTWYSFQFFKRFLIPVLCYTKILNFLNLFYRENGKREIRSLTSTFYRVKARLRNWQYEKRKGKIRPVQRKVEKLNAKSRQSGTFLNDLMRFFLGSCFFFTDIRLCNKKINTTQFAKVPLCVVKENNVHSRIQQVIQRYWYWKGTRHRYPLLLFKHALYYSKLSRSIL